MGSRRRRILLADDHVPTREEFAAALERAGFDVVATCGDGVAAVVEALRTEPDVCLLDVQMPRVSGIEAAAAISARLPGVRIVLMTVSSIEEREVDAAIRAGAHGYLTKDVDADTAAQAVHGIASGETAFAAGHGVTLARKNVA